MKLSVVIVNYNVKYFLKQCLASVYGSQRRLADGTELALEVWVVDNDSVDGSAAMVASEYPEAHLIANRENLGFARANNQALCAIAGDGGEGCTGAEPPHADGSSCEPRPESSNSSGGDDDYLLLLNPDTVVERDTFVKCVDFMRATPQCGGLCVKMLDGNGQYLKESKRGFPTPQASFYKISGLIRLFPRSPRIAAYYMGHLPEDETHEIDIMPGAFLMFSRAVYNRIGGLDESYFMYGEDIDFSWRIRLAGYSNYYFPQTHIIHYKGESTKKGSMNYVYTFYNAMAIFVRKYFTGRNARLFNALLQAAIWMRAGMAWLRRIASGLALPLADFAVAYGGFVALKTLWASAWADNIHYYPTTYTTVVIPLYILILMAGSWLRGGYDLPLKRRRIVGGMAAGLVILLAFYSLLDEGRRYSRMLLLAGSLWTLLGTLAIRQVLAWAKVKGYATRAHRQATVLVVGQADEAERVSALYAALGSGQHTVQVPPDLDARHLRDTIRIEHADEVVFCGRDLDLQRIIGLMADLRTTGVAYKIAPAEGDYVIGSDSILSPDSLYLDDLDTVSTTAGRRRKRLFDVGSSLLLLLASPLLVWPQRHRRRYLRHCASVLAGRTTWVGHTGRPGIFRPSDLLPRPAPQDEQRLMLRYMRHYKTSTDAAILLRHWNDL